MRNGKLIKLAKTTDNVSKAPLRTNDIEGSFETLPEVDGCFRIFGKSLDPNLDCRLVTTSLIKSVKKNGSTITFETMNSKYKLELLDEN